MNRIYKLPELPLLIDIETKPVLKQVALAHRKLGVLKGIIATVPNASILINTLALQEAKDSSAIESIITTHDELYKAELFVRHITSPAAKEVQTYARALKHGFDMVCKNGLLTNNTIVEIYRIIKENTAGFRTTPGTTLKNERTAEIIYEPPQTIDEIRYYMDNLEKFIHNNGPCEPDPLIKMAIIHHQFESIHPFSDGNGRTGRIINILYLVLQNLLGLPVLYLSRYIIKHKGEYYRLLQAVRDSSNPIDDWEQWVLFMLKGVEQTATETIGLVTGIQRLMLDYKHRIRSEFPGIYSQELINNLFKHPYTKIKFLMEDTDVTRPTATSYLEQLVDGGYVEKIRLGKENFYLNRPLFELLTDPFPPSEMAAEPHQSAPRDDA